MRAIAIMFRAVLGDRRAATAVEYGLVLALCVLVVIAGITVVASETTGMWNNVHDAVVTH